MSKMEVNEERFATRRVEALTDGVFAIAMTLLVLDLNVSDFGHVVSNSDLWSAILDQQTSIISFVISFLMLGSVWAVHMRQFEFIKRTDRHMTAINTLRLLVVVIFPLTASIAGEYPDLVLGRILLPLNFFLLTVIGYWQWSYAIKHKFYTNLSPEAITNASVRNKAIISVSLLVVVGSVWLGEAAFALLLLTFVFIKLLSIPGYKNAKA